MPAIDIDDLIDALRQAGLTLAVDKLGNVVQPGLMVTRVQNGYLIHNLGKDLQPLRLTETQIAAIVQRFPALQPILTRNADTWRRAHFLEERQKSSIYSHFFSLDPDRPMPPPGTANVHEPEKLPRLYAALDETGDQPILNIFGSEHGIKSAGLRPDEAQFALEITKAEAAQLKTATSIDDCKKVLAKVRTSNARVLYYDDNRIIRGELGEKHALKCFDTLEAWTIHVLEELKIKIRGELFVHVTEDLVLQPGALIEDSGVSAARFKPAFEPPGKPMTTSHYSNRISITEVNGAVNATQVPGAEFHEFSETLSKIDLKQLKTRAAKVVKAIENAIIKAG